MNLSIGKLILHITEQCIVHIFITVVVSSRHNSFY